MLRQAQQDRGWNLGAGCQSELVEDLVLNASTSSARQMMKPGTGCQSEPVEDLVMNASTSSARQLMSICQSEPVEDLSAFFQP